MSTLKVDNIQTSSGTTYNFIKQVKGASFTDVQTMTENTRTDITNLSIDITPSSTSSKMLIMASITYGCTDANLYASGYLMRDSTDIGVGTTASGSRQNISFPLNMSGAGYEAFKCYQHSITFLDSPNTTNQVTYKVQVRHDVAGTMYINRSGSDANDDYGHRGISTLNIMEIAG